MLRNIIRLNAWLQITTFLDIKSLPDLNAAAKTPIPRCLHLKWLNSKPSIEEGNKMNQTQKNTLLFVGAVLVLSSLGFTAYNSHTTSKAAQATLEIAQKQAEDAKIQRAKIETAAAEAVRLQEERLTHKNPQEKTLAETPPQHSEQTQVALHAPATSKIQVPQKNQKTRAIQKTRTPQKTEKARAIPKAQAAPKIKKTQEAKSKAANPIINAAEGQFKKPAESSPIWNPPQSN